METQDLSLTEEFLFWSDVPLRNRHVALKVNIGKFLNPCYSLVFDDHGLCRRRQGIGRYQIAEMLMMY